MTIVIILGGIAVVLVVIRLALVWYDVEYAARREGRLP